ncbi:hypothetical protein WJX73_001639 [Symbiochloris irregularis]|uniref:Htaa domain-containing protein n=1 Tax=Symbiochloris irregularis TaxID=706552 RepID=A0AAW1NMA7_9CHLO
MAPQKMVAALALLVLVLVASSAQAAVVQSDDKAVTLGRKILDFDFSGSDPNKGVTWDVEGSKADGVRGTFTGANGDKSFDFDFQKP